MNTHQLPILRIYISALAATLLMWGVFFILNSQLDGTCWDGMRVSKSALTTEYCELNRTEHFFHQRMNTYSNLAYFFLGMIVIGVANFDRKNLSASGLNVLQQFPPLSYFVGACLVYLAMGSAFFHASMTWVGQRVDMNGTYSVCLALIGIAVCRRYTATFSVWRNRWFLLSGLVVSVVIFIELHLRIKSIVLLPFLILIILVLTVLNYRSNKIGFRLSIAVLGALFMIVADILRTLDVKKIGCDPTSFYQGHTLWHFFTAMSVFFLYWFYRNERVTE